MNILIDKLIRKINNSNVNIQRVEFKDKILWEKKKPIITKLDDDKYFGYSPMVYTFCFIEKGYLYVYYKTKEGRGLNFFKNNVKDYEKYENPRRIVLNSKGDYVVELELKYEPSVDIDTYSETSDGVVISEYMLTDEEVKQFFKSYI